MSAAGNIADALRAAAAQAPERVAMQVPVGGDGARTRFVALTYGELDRDSDAIAAGALADGLEPGTRVALMVRPGVPFFVLMFGLFKAGLVPVLIDPGLDRRALKTCLDEAEPAAFFGIPLAHVARLVLGWARGSNRYNLTVGTRLGWSGTTYAALLARGRAALAAGARLPMTQKDDLAAILFTSGSTGLPKGVEYRHRMFLAQVELIRAAFGIRAGEIDLPTFPPFALFDPGLGMTSVIPALDPTRPARADPARLIATIEQHACTTMFGSPALLDTLSRYAEAHAIRVTSLRRVLSAGAPVRPDVVARTYRMLPPDAELWTPYGATECLPVAVIEGREILADAAARTDAGAGICVGRPLAANTVRVIAIDDAAIADWQDARELATGAIGEITVTGPSVTEAYFRRDQATALAKIRERLPDGSSRIVHRMGDVGYFDENGRLWYCGRKAHRVETPETTLYSECVEGIFNAVPGVRRSALVGVGPRGRQVPVVCIERLRGAGEVGWLMLTSALRARAAQFAMTAQLSVFLEHPAFPVDIRHNAKIGREQLARWAGTRLERGKLV